MLVTRRHESGLLLAETGAEETGLRRALKQLDDRLRLLPPGLLAGGSWCPYWRVVRVVSDDRPPLPVLSWMDANMDPLPLSSGLIEEVKRHRRDSRHREPDADQRNAAHIEAMRKLRAESVQALHDEYAPHIEKGRTGVSMATSKRRRYWQRDHGAHR